MLSFDDDHCTALTGKAVLTRERSRCVPLRTGALYADGRSEPSLACHARQLCSVTDKPAASCITRGQRQHAARAAASRISGPSLA